MKLLNLFLNWRPGEESQLAPWPALGKSDSPSPTKAMPKVSVNTQAGRDPWEEGLSDTTGGISIVVSGWGLLGRRTLCGTQGRWNQI